MRTGFARALVDDVAPGGLPSAAERSIRVHEAMRGSADRSILIVGSEGQDPYGTLDRAVRSEAWEAIVFLAETGDPQDALRALDHGAHDVVSPPHSVSAIRLRAEVLRRRFRGWWDRAADTPVEAPGLDLEPASRRVRVDFSAVDLSSREYELLERLAEASGNVVSRSTLLKDIWGAEQESEAVLDATVHRLRTKLERDIAEPRIVTTVRGIGYRLEQSAFGSTPSGWEMARAG